MYNIMLVEDDSTLRFIYSKMKIWSKYGFNIIAEASNGEQAITLLDKYQIDVVFTDIRMPFMNGIELMRTVNRKNSKTLFVLISAYNEFEYAREGLRLGAVDYLVKPLEERDVEKTLVKILGKRVIKEKYSLFQLLMDIVKDTDIKSDALLQKTCDCIEKNINKNMTIEQIADELQMNKDYLSKQIQNKTGIKFRKLYNLLKVEYSKHLILGGQLKIYEICDMLGYSSPDYFTQLFKTVTGLTPAEYKK